MNIINNKIFKRIFAIALALVLVVALGRFMSDDSKLHAQEEVTEDYSDYDDYTEDYAEDYIDASYFDEEYDEWDDSVWDEASDASSDYEGSDADFDSNDFVDEAVSDDSLESDADIFEEDFDDYDDYEDYEFDAASAYDDFQNMDLADLYDYLAGLSEEELAELEAYAESIEIDDSAEDAFSYTVIFQDYDGTELSSQVVEEFGRAVPPADPVREGYVFRGWDKDYTCVAEDMVITAKYITAEEAAALDALSVEISFNDLTNEQMQFGDTIQLYSTITGLAEGRGLAYQWQYSRTGGLTWEDVEDASGDIYEFVITEDNYTLKWRLEVTLI